MTKRAVTLALAVMLAATPAWPAEDCAPDVQSAQESARQTYIQGMSGLAGNNFSARPGTFSSMGCLDKFMQGNLDIFFRPPQLNDLLGMVLNFACQKLQQQVGGAAGGMGGGIGNLTGLLGGLAGGLNVPAAGGGSSIVNLNQVLGGVTSGASPNGGLSSLFQR